MGSMRLHCGEVCSEIIVRKATAVAISSDFLTWQDIPRKVSAVEALPSVAD